MKAKITKLSGRWEGTKSVFYDVELENVPFETGKQVKLMLEKADDKFKEGDEIEYIVDYHAKSSKGKEYIQVSLDKPKPKEEKQTGGRPQFVLDGKSYSLPKTPEETALIVVQSTMSSVLHFCGLLPEEDRKKPENEPVKKTRELAKEVFNIANEILEEQKK